MDRATEYRRRLENELASLRTRRVNLRKRLDWLKSHVIGDPTETAMLYRETQMALNATNYDWERVHERLGRAPYGGPPVKLLPPSTVRKPARTVTRSAPAMGYMHRAMMGRR